MAEIETLIDERIEKELRALDTVYTREQKEATIKAICDLHGLRTEELKLKVEEANSKQQKKDFWTRSVLTLVEIGVPVVFYGTWMRKGFKFEETGSFTSTTFKNLFGKFKPFK